MKSLKLQTEDHELILIDNTQKKFKSAPEALNYGGERANGKYIMFVHQDIDLNSKTWLADAEKLLGSLNNLGVAGVAGKSENEKGMITNIKQGIPPKLAGINQIKNPKKVQTLDECLIIVPKSSFNRLKFDEEVCSGWHLYAVDYCLSVGEMDLEVYVIPQSLHHMSSGASFSKEYYVILKKLLKKHEKHYKKVYTSMGDWNISYPLCLQKILQRLIRYVSKLKQRISEE